MLVRIYRIGETCGHDQVTPVSIGKFHRRTQLFHASLAATSRAFVNLHYGWLHQLVRSRMATVSLKSIQLSRAIREQHPSMGDSRL
jgi:hypothetical protein